MNLKLVGLVVWNVYAEKTTHQSSMLWPRLASALLWKMELNIPPCSGEDLWQNFIFGFGEVIDVFCCSDKG